MITRIVLLMILITLNHDNNGDHSYGRHNHMTADKSQPMKPIYGRNLTSTTEIEKVAGAESHGYDRGRQGECESGHQDISLYIQIICMCGCRVFELVLNRMAR